MDKKILACVTGVAGYVPDNVVTNADLEKILDTNDEWIRTRTGIRERRHLKGEGLATGYMAKRAVERLLAKTNTAPGEIELVIFCTVSPDHVFPATANKLTHETGMVNAWGFDLEAACSGFMYGMTVGKQFIETGFHKKVIVVGADMMSSMLDMEDRATAIIFGDGAGAILLEPNAEGLGMQDCILRSDGGGFKYLYQKAGGSMLKSSAETIANKENTVYQDGKTVFKFAVTNMADVSAEIMARNNLTADDVQWLAPHQANKRIIDATRERMGLDEKKVMINIDRYGNTTNGTLPLLLTEYESQLKKGDNIIFASFGGGFTWGSMYMKWGYDGASVPAQDEQL